MLAAPRQLTYIRCAMNQLYYGDNLEVLRRYVKDESVDLVYLDPPFKSNQDYNVLFAEKDGTGAASQIKAFEDTWEWNMESVRVFEELVESGGRVSDVMRAFRQFLGTNDMLAYLTMMAPRLVELHRVLKSTGSIYLHCDPAASHYLKLLLDAVFGPRFFRNEIIWKRTSGHSDAHRFGQVHDVILYFSKTEAAEWNHVYQPYEAGYVEQYYRYEDQNGRKFMSADLGAAGLQGGGYDYVWKGVRRVWRCPPETMKRLDDEGKIFYTRNGIPRLKRYLDESKGMPAQDVITDIEALRIVARRKTRLSNPKARGTPRTTHQCQHRRRRNGPRPFLRMRHHHRRGPKTEAKLDRNRCHPPRYRANQESAADRLRARNFRRV